MTDNLERAKKILCEGGCTLAIVRDEDVFTSTDRGVKPLIDLLDSGKLKGGFCAADKVVGKAAAFLYVLLGAERVYAHVISKPAFETFDNYGIRAEYGTLTEAIKNRTNTGFCPMETAVMDINEPSEALEAIRKKLVEMKSTNQL